MLPFSRAFPILFVLLLLRRLFKPLWLLQSFSLLWLPEIPISQHSCVKSGNSWNLAMSALLSSCPSGDQFFCLQFYHHCCPEHQQTLTSTHVSADHNISLCLMAGLPLRHCPLSYSAFTLSSLFCCKVYPSTVMPVAADSLSVSLPWGLDFATHWSLAELVFCPWEDCCKSMVFPSRHLFLSVQFLLLALYCHSCFSLVL